MTTKDEALYRLDACEVRVNQRWKHTKTGGVYTIVATGLAEATLSPVVIYAGHDGIVWVRALDVFIGNNDEGQQRFHLLEDEAYVDRTEQTLPFPRVTEWRPTDGFEQRPTHAEEAL
jgi:hypothetical protein